MPERVFKWVTGVLAAAVDDRFFPASAMVAGVAGVALGVLAALLVPCGQ